MKRVLKVACATVASFAAVACTDFDSATDLNAEGPPMIQQVRLTETYTLAGGSATATRKVFAFGTHPDATDADQHTVTTATANANKLRVIVDELLVGNYLEEIACRAPVDDDAYAALPVGATPDDVARCAGPQDILPGRCVGQKAVCMCALDAGCLVGSAMVAKGAPVGVLDINQDGAADDTRLIPGVVGLRCGAIDVPLDLDMSYWTPSGNQLVPAQGGFDALGPALVMTPQRGLPTNLDCNLTIADTVVDKQGERLCTPVNGDTSTSCTPGDISQFSFGVEPLSIAPASFADMATGVNRTAPALFISNTSLDAATIQGVTMQNATTNAAFTAFTIDQAMTPAMRTIRLNFVPPTCAACPATGLPANTQFRVTIPTSVHDGFGQGAPAPTVVTFTTGA